MSDDHRLSDKEIEKLSRECERTKRMFNFLLKSVCDNFFEINVQTGMCVMIDAADFVEEQENYNEQIRWFANNMIVEEERESYLKNFEFTRLLHNLRKNKGYYEMNCNVEDKDGQRGLKVLSKLVTDHRTGEEYIYSYARDISEVKKQEEKNRQLIEISRKLLNISQNDGLTGLYNRTAAEKEISDYIGENYDENWGSLIIIDIDNFKSYNDNYGHSGGDLVLKFVASSIKENFRSNDILCRWGGDEFLIFMKDTNNRNSVRSRLERLRLRTQVMNLKGMDICITLSMGAVIARNRYGLEELFECADQVLYEVKKEGKNSYKICALESLNLEE